MTHGVVLKLELNRELAEFIGIMLGDGSLGIYKCTSKGITRMQYRVKITMNSEEDMQYAQKVVIPLIFKIFSVQPHLRKRDGEKTIDILIFSKEIVMLWYALD